MVPAIMIYDLVSYFSIKQLQLEVVSVDGKICIHELRNVYSFHIFAKTIKIFKDN